MPQHSNGKAMSQPHNMWRPDSEFWSANRAEHRFADGYELVVFDLPAANGSPAIIGWELFRGLWNGAKARQVAVKSKREEDGREEPNSFRDRRRPNTYSRV